MKRVILFLSIIFLVLQGHAQEPNGFHVTGSLGVSTEFYQFSATDSSLMPRRPDFNYRVFFNPEFHFGKNFSLPMSFLLTKRFSQAYLPLPSYDNPLRSLTNPNNAIGLSPTFGWATFHLGSHTANFSELSTGNQPIFGAGIDLRPGNWRLAYSQGVMNWALQPDTTFNLTGNFTRKFQALKLGWGKGKTYLYVNTTKISDDENSIESTGLNPEEGALFTVQLGLEFSKHISGKVEFGASAFTKDLAADSSLNSNITWLPESVFVVNETTRLDYAHILSLSFDFAKWGLTLKQKQLGAGYEPLGFGFVETDILDRTATPRLSLFNNKFILNATVGLREDNISRTKVTTTRRLIASGNATAIFSNSFSVSGVYSNYGSRNNVQNDSFRLEFVSKNLSITPLYRFTTDGVVHSLSATYAQSDFNDKNLISGELASNKTEILNGNYNIRAGRFSTNVSASLMTNQRSTGNLDIKTLSIRPGYEPVKRKLKMSLGLVYAIIAQEGYTESTRLLLRPRLQWRPTRQLTFRMTGSLQTYRYGSVRNNASYDESFLQTSIVQNF